MLDHLCYIGLDSPNHTEFIYAQIVRDELGYGGSVTRFNPLANTRQDLMDFMRTRPEKMFVVIGSAELAMRKFLVFYTFMEVFQVVSKDGLKMLLDYEVRAMKPDTPLSAEPQDLVDSTKNVSWADELLSSCPKIEITDPRR